jgi:hypothetical protein
VTQARKKEESRPIIFYVSRVAKELPNLNYLDSERVTVVDIELTEQSSDELLSLLKGRKAEQVGTIRIRLYGHLVLG